MKERRSSLGLGKHLDNLALKVLKENKGEKARGGVYRYRAAFMELVEIASRKDKDLYSILEIWSHLNMHMRLRYTLDELCEASGIDPARVLGGAAAAAYEMGMNAGSLIAMQNFPEIIQSSVDSANIPGKDGAKDRDLLMRHARFVPIPEGQTINIQNIAQAGKSSGFQSFEDAMRESDGVIRDAEVVGE